MAETRLIDLPVIGMIVKAYVASVPTIITLSAPGGTGAIYGLSDAIPPNGNADSLPVTVGASRDHTFFLDPGDELWVSLPAAPVGVPDVSLVASPME